MLGIGGKPDTAMCIRYEASYQIEKEALSTKPRNCDKYTTLDDACNAFFEGYVPGETRFPASAFGAWLLSEAKEDEK